MTKRSTIAAFAGICACVCWVMTSAQADSPTPASKGVQSATPHYSVKNKAEESTPPDRRDRSYLVTPSSVGGQLQLAPTYPLAVPGTVDLGVDATVQRGGPPPVECVSQPCEAVIYENLDVVSFGSLGDPDGIPTCDDLTLAGTDRFICSILVGIGGVGGTNETESVTLELQTGDIQPNCPDNDPASRLVYTATRNYQLTNPPSAVVFTLDPPVLVDANFVWLCLSSANTDAGWGLTGQAETGSTQDLFVIPSGNGECTFGGGGDYFFYGGNPVAGFAVEIKANPGPLGACCNRDVVPAVCTDGVLRANCVNTLVNVWKEGLCSDFNDTVPTCTSCLTVAQCTANTPEGEANCGPGAQDSFNSGCLADNTAGIISFSPIACGQTICGTSGNFQSFCTQNSECAAGVICVGNACNGETDARDQDWYELTLTAEREVTWSVTGRFPFEMTLMNNGGDHDTCTFTTRQVVTGKTCETQTITECLPAGSWWLRIRPTIFVGVPCGSRYQVNVACANPCAVPLVYGACCDATVTGCSERPDKACTPRGGTYQGDNTTCAVEGADCPGIPVNDQCEDKLQLTGVAVMKTFDTSFATDTDLPPANSPAGPDTPAACSVGAPPNPQPQMREDIFYNYTIPTNLAGVPLNAGILSISMSGSTFDGFMVVYGDTGATGGTYPCGSTLCDDQQIDCNDDILFNAENPFSFNAAPHLNFVVEAGSTEFFDPGDCIKIRVGTPTANAGGPGLLNIDLIPQGPSPWVQGDGGTGRCCYWNSGTQTAGCQIATSQSTCESSGGYYRHRADYYDGANDISQPLLYGEPLVGCKSSPCPEAGDACYTAIELDFDGATPGSGSGSLTRLAGDVLYYAYTVPSGVNGIVIDGCGTTGFFDPQIAVYSALEADGDCDLGSLVATNNDCQVTQSTATGALQVSSCYGGINATSDPCLCVPVNAAGGPQSGEVIYIAIGGHNDFNGLPPFPGSNRDVIDPVPSELGGDITIQLNIQTVAQCFACAAPCPGGSTPEGGTICEDTNDPGTVDSIGPQDLYNGGCFATPPTFNGPTLTCSTTPVVVCGKAGNFQNPYPCDSPADCPSGLPCSGLGGACDGTPFINRDTDWYEVVVTTPSVIRWRVNSAEFASEIGIVADVSGDCSNAFFLAFDDVTFPCEPPTGTATTLEVTAAVCGAPADGDLKYYLYIAPSVFGGLGETSCNSNYVAQVSCEPFVQLADCCEGDMNNDGKVNGRDIPKWIDTLYFPPTLFDGFQGCFAANFCRGDVSGNGVVDLATDLVPFVNLLVGSSKPTCPSNAVDCFDPAFGQPTGPLGSGDVGGVMSDLDLLNDFRAADCFCPAENGVIDSICWWGGYVDFSGAECGPEPDCFQVSFYLNNNVNGPCPGTRLEPPGAQFVATITREESGGSFIASSDPNGLAVTEFLYTATLPVPVTVTAGQCLWIEIVNNSPQSDCKWFWSTSPFGDTRHAEIDISPATGNLPTVYSTCTAANHPAMDLAFNVGVHIDKEGCGLPQGRCCYDAAPLGVIDCVVTSADRCEAIFFGEWSEGGSCPPSPACTVGRCCYLNPSDPTQTLCAITMKTTCDTLDQTSPQLSSRAGLWTAGVASCGTSPCPTGHCCVGDPGACSVTTEIRCLELGGSAWVAGTNCTGFTCPTGICDNASRCQLPHVLTNVQQGGYVSDDDNATFTADDFRPSVNGTISQICWRGFHSSNGCDGGVGTSETFTVNFFRSTSGGAASGLPNLAQNIGSYTVTPAKSIPVPNEASPGPLNSQQYKYDAFLSPAVSVSSGQCYWVEIQNTSTACVWLWATSDEGGNNHAAIRNNGGTPFGYQDLDRDLAFCLGPVNLNGASCTYSPAAPSNNACASAITLLTGVANTLVGTTIGSTRDGTASCGSSSTVGGDVWYRVTTSNSAVTEQTLTISTCAIRTTYDSVVSVHLTAPDFTPECPGTSGSQILPSSQSCNDEGACTLSIGANQLFFPNVQARRVLATNVITPGKTYLVRVSGKNNTANQGGSRGWFSITATEP